MTATLARTRTSLGPPRPTPTRPRERACRRDGLECLPSIEYPCPATPFRAPGLGLSGSTAWPPLSRFTTPLARADPCGSSRAWVPVHAPRCRRKTRLSEPSASPDDFCNRIRRAGTPYELSTLAREWEACAPLLAGTNRCRLRRPLDASPHREPASRDLTRAGFRTSRSTCVDGFKSRIEALERRLSCALLMRSRRPSS